MTKQVFTRQRHKYCDHEGPTHDMCFEYTEVEVERLFACDVHEGLHPESSFGLDDGFAHTKNCVPIPTAPAMWVTYGLEGE